MRDWILRALPMRTGIHLQRWTDIQLRENKTDFR